MTISRTEQNKAAFRLLIEKAMPEGHFDVIRERVAETAVTERAGFAALYRALGDAIPEQGNFYSGWKMAGNPFLRLSAVRK